jgi:hypothetical protein
MDSLCAVCWCGQKQMKSSSLFLYRMTVSSMLLIQDFIIASGVQKTESLLLLESILSGHLDNLLSVNLISRSLP